ncbi:hypothetical protein AAFF_G00379880 [Aldrovandia affinis]|uniref:Uncharacterized protein n=1 Tax=Aldrovandia affinis TaxID=143900 RepID=A0AAD7R4K5_9TELE|nr:hypothetical protein AAFF_G00379880 [Aldrovandia affinis]
MRGLLLKLLFSLMLCFFILGTILTVFIWYIFNHSDVKPHSSSNLARRTTDAGSSGMCRDCRENTIDKMVELYSHAWKKQNGNFNKFRSQLASRCHGLSKAIVTQANTPLKSKIVYDGEKRNPLQVTPKLFSTFVKEQPFENVTWKTCAVVGNGGILINSSCGEAIDSAHFVFRCNLPPLDKGYEKDVGNKTNLVTANPSILLEKFEGLMEHRAPLWRVWDFSSPIRPVFLNPEYLRNLARFWRTQGLRVTRLSTGLIMSSLALELCASVHLYGFWPYAQHPHDRQPLINHYYDNRQGKKTVHAMPAEFAHLLHLHRQGVVRVHLGQCPR